MTSEFFEYNKHVTVVNGWLTHRGWPELSRDMIPETGIVVSSGLEPVACGFLYKTDSNIAILEWVVGNPFVTHEIRASGLDFLIKSLLKIGKSYGFSFAFSYTKNERLLEKYRATGFTETDHDMVHGIWRL